MGKIKTFILCAILFPQIGYALTAHELINRMDNLYRSDSSQAVMRMTIITPDWQRTMEMESWSLGKDYALVRIIAPKKDAGIATLKRDAQMWNFFPKVKRVIKVPPSMMMGSWMGSDFTNDDLVREASLEDDYDVGLNENQGGDTEYVLTLIPKAKTVTVWDKIQIWITKDNLLPTKQVYFDEAGKPMREMVFSNIQEFNGRKLPSTMILTPLNKQGHKTQVEYTQLNFNVSLKESFFSLRELKR